MDHVDSSATLLGTVLPGEGEEWEILRTFLEKKESGPDILNLAKC